MTSSLFPYQMLQPYFPIQKKTMENSQHLATESFSYSWLTDKKPTLQLPDNNNSNEDHQRTEHNFHFDVSLSSSPFGLMIHADEIFSHGRIMPIYIDQSRADTWHTSASVPSSPYPFTIANEEYRAYNFFRKLRKLSCKKILVRCFGFVKSIGCSRKSSRVDDLERKVCEVRNYSPSRQSSCNSTSVLVDSSLSHVKKIGGYNNKDGFCYNGLKRVASWGGSPQGSTRNISPFSPRLGNDVESSIHEAILYCKRSIEK